MAGKGMTAAQHIREAEDLAAEGARHLRGIGPGASSYAEAYARLAQVHLDLAQHLAEAPASAFDAVEPRAKLRDLLGQAPAVTFPNTRDADAFGGWLDRLRELAGGA